jgi:hypothetical protein
MLLMVDLPDSVDMTITSGLTFQPAASSALRLA